MKKTKRKRENKGTQNTKQVDARNARFKRYTNTKKRKRCPRTYQVRVGLYTNSHSVSPVRTPVLLLARRGLRPLD